MLKKQTWTPDQLLHLFKGSLAHLYVLPRPSGWEHEGTYLLHLQQLTLVSQAWALVHAPPVGFFDGTATAEDLLATATRVYRQAGTAMSVSCAPRLPAIPCDAELLGRFVLQIPLQVAVMCGQRVEIGATLDGDHVLFSFHGYGATRGHLSDQAARLLWEAGERVVRRHGGIQVVVADPAGDRWRAAIRLPAGEA